MKVLLDTENSFYFLKNLPQFLGVEGEEWKRESQQSFRPVSTVSLGQAELPTPLRNIGIQLRSTGKLYNGQANIFCGEPISFSRLSGKLGERFPASSDYRWSSIRTDSIEGYIYEGDSSVPSFAVDYGVISKRAIPVFFIYMGVQGAKSRVLDSEESFIQDIGAFQYVVSGFIDACLSLKRKQSVSSKRKVMVPSCLELSFSNVQYGC